MTLFLITRYHHKTFCKFTKFTVEITSVQNFSSAVQLSKDSGGGKFAISLPKIGCQNTLQNVGLKNFLEFLVTKFCKDKVFVFCIVCVLLFACISRFSFQFSHLLDNYSVVIIIEKSSHD